MIFLLDNKPLSDIMESPSLKELIMEQNVTADQNITTKRKTSVKRKTTTAKLDNKPSSDIMESVLTKELIMEQNATTDQNTPTKRKTTAAKRKTTIEQKKKTLAQKRREPGFFYKEAARLAYEAWKNPDNPKEQRAAARESWRRAKLALEFCREDPIWAYRHFMRFEEEVDE